MNNTHPPMRKRARRRAGRRARPALLLLVVAALVALAAPVAGAAVQVIPVDPPPGDGEGGGGGPHGGGELPAPNSDIDCDNIYINWWDSLDSVAKGMWNSAPGWSGCIGVTAQGIDASGSYTVKVPYLTTGTNSSARSGRKDVVLVHGATFDADGWQHMCKYLLAKYPNNLYRCFAPSLTGMGGSAFPGANNDWANGESLVQLGGMHEIEFAGALDAALAGIKAREGLAVGEWILAGYSNGGLAIQMLQNRLADQGTHLRAKYGIDKVVMMDSVLPHEVCWQFGDDVANHTDDAGYPFTTACDDDAESDLFWELVDTFRSQQNITNLNAGWFADPKPSLDNDEWVETWWGAKYDEDDIESKYEEDDYGRLPTTSEAYDAANWMGWDTFSEMVGVELGVANYTRPSIDPDIWAGTATTCYDRSSTGYPCTRFVSVSFNMDKYIYPDDVQNLHRYLTKSSPTCVTADTAYHDCVKVDGTHGAAFSLYATAWDSYVKSGYNTSKLTTQMDPIWNKLVVS